MKNKFFKTVSAIISVCILFSSLMSTVSAEFDPSDPYSIPTTREEIDEYKQRLVSIPYGIFVKPLDDESLVKAEEFILANDRAGLYDFLMDYNGYNEYRDGWLVYWATQYTGRYITNDNGAYRMMLLHEVFPHYYNGEPLAPATPTAGDINFDGNVSLFDIIMINKMSVGAVLPQNMYQAQAADVDGSMVIDNEDVYLTMQYVLGLIEAFPDIEN